MCNCRDGGRGWGCSMQSCHISMRRSGMKVNNGPAPRGSGSAHHTGMVTQVNNGALVGYTKAVVMEAEHMMMIAVSCVWAWWRISDRDDHQWGTESDGGGILAAQNTSHS
jgi:hypothetical protein